MLTFSALILLFEAYSTVSLEIFALCIFHFQWAYETANVLRETPHLELHRLLSKIPFLCTSDLISTVNTSLSPRYY